MERNGADEELFGLMPSTRLRNIVNIPVVWFRDLSDRKVAIDAISLFIKSLPGVVGVALLMLIPLAFVSLKSLAAIYSQYPVIFIVIVTVIASVAATYLINYFFGLSLSRKLISLDPHKDFSIKQYVFLGKVKSAAEVTYAYRMIVKAKVDNITSFPIVQSWSGVGEISVIPRSKSCTVSGPHKVPGNMIRHDIIFTEPMRKGETRLIEYTVPTRALENHLPLPHMALTIRNGKYPAFNTYIVVVFSEDAKPITLYRDYFFGGYAAGRVKNVAIEPDDRLRHVWDLRFRVGWAYCLRWEL